MKLYPRAFRHRNYRLFYGGQLVSLTGSWMHQVAMGWLLLDITAPETRALWIGIVSAVGAAPGLGLSLLAGTVADRLPKRAVLLVTQTVLMVIVLSLALLTHLEWASVGAVVVISLLTGTANTFDAPVRQSFVVEMVGGRKEDLPQAIALNSAMFNSARLLGPAVAGWAIARIGLAGAFLANGLSYLAVIAGLAAMRLPRLDRSARAEGGGGVRDGLRYIRRTPLILSLLCLATVMSVFAGSYATVLPLFARETLGADVAQFGHLVSLVGAGAILGALTLATASRPRPLVLLLGVLAMSGALTALSFARDLLHAQLTMPFIGWGMMTTMASINTLIQVSVPDSVRGRVVSAYTLSFMGMAPLGGLQAGAVAQVWGVPWALRVGACAAALAVLLLARWILPGPAREETGEPLPHDA